MEKKDGVDALNPNVDGDKYPKLAKATELANNYKIRAEKAEAKNKKLAKVEAKPSKKLKKDKEGFDYAEKAYLKTSDVKPEEFELVEKIMAATGRTLDEVLDSKYFRAEQTELREAKASADAVPDGTKRSGKSSKSAVGYWLAKNEMPPADQPELRREYVNAKSKSETSGSKFTPNPVR